MQVGSRKDERIALHEYGHCVDGLLGHKLFGTDLSDKSAYYNNEPYIAARDWGVEFKSRKDETLFLRQFFANRFADYCLSPAALEKRYPFTYRDFKRLEGRTKKMENAPR